MKQHFTVILKGAELDVVGEFDTDTETDTVYFEVESVKHKDVEVVELLSNDTIIEIEDMAKHGDYK